MSFTQQTGAISVAMCTYNGEKFLPEQLQSIAKQTMLPAELVVCDDGSKDSTIDILKDFALEAPFEVKVVQNPKNLGFSKNFEKAVGLCGGQYIALCDQDDVWLPEKLARLAEVLERDPQIGGVFSEAQLVDQQSKPTGVLLSHTTGFSRKEQHRLGQGEALRVLLPMNKVYGCSLMFRASLLPKILPVPPSWTHDNWIACMAAVHAKLEFIPEPLFCFRIHATQYYGAAKPPVSTRVQQWRRSAKDYFEEAEPQLAQLQERMQAENNPSLQPHLEYLRGRTALLRKRASLPSNRLLRTGKVLMAATEHHRFFNGWRSIIKDLTA